ncbi:hypothetical protein BC941DRAFT_422725 [Chlamydoabsidia padenii]|nr:hypothetical protein BC941DRAFT_422725 [Chlamydoabsidia padenii]
MFFLLVFPWKKKRASRSKSTIMPNFTNSDLGFTSSASLPITPRDVIYTTKPPCYYERTCKIQQSSRLDDDEEGNEDLPPYECTVYKMGFMMIKTELEEPTKKLRRRSWR